MIADGSHVRGKGYRSPAPYVAQGGQVGHGNSHRPTPGQCRRFDNAPVCVLIGAQNWWSIYDGRYAMRIELQPFVAATLAVTLLAACGAEKETPAAAAPAAGQQTVQTTQTTTAEGTTTTFGESTPEEQQPPVQ